MAWCGTPRRFQQQSELNVPQGPGVAPRWDATGGSRDRLVPFGILGAELTLPQPHARAAAAHGNEFNAGVFENLANGLRVNPHSQEIVAFEVTDVSLGELLARNQRQERQISARERIYRDRSNHCRLKASVFEGVTQPDANRADHPLQQARPY